MTNRPWVDKCYFSQHVTTKRRLIDQLFVTSRKSMFLLFSIKALLPLMVSERSILYWDAYLIVVSFL